MLKMPIVVYLAKYRMPLFFIAVGTLPAVFMARLLLQIPESWNLWGATLMVMVAIVPLYGAWALARGLWQDLKARRRGGAGQ